MGGWNLPDDVTDHMIDMAQPGYYDRYDPEEDRENEEHDAAIEDFLEARAVSLECGVCGRLFIAGELHRCTGALVSREVVMEADIPF